jgi:hypothetical protein
VINAVPSLCRPRRHLGLAVEFAPWLAGSNRLPPGLSCTGSVVGRYSEAVGDLVNERLTIAEGASDPPSLLATYRPTRADHSRTPSSVGAFSCASASDSHCAGQMWRRAIAPPRLAFTGYSEVRRYSLELEFC